MGDSERFEFSRSVFERIRMMGKFLEIYPVCVLVLNLSKFAITFVKNFSEI